MNSVPSDWNEVSENTFEHQSAEVKVRIEHVVLDEDWVEKRPHEHWLDVIKRGWAVTVYYTASGVRLCELKHTDDESQVRSSASEYMSEFNDAYSPDEDNGLEAAMDVIARWKS